ncbi:unnamed protein product [Linum trigynum]|uniref:Uncharacterized protein n=1 Tax=Linum trigynum TaxID=586398 RepID=A0AAV2D1U7_9ROSI
MAIEGVWWKEGATNLNGECDEGVTNPRGSAAVLGIVNRNNKQRGECESVALDRSPAPRSPRQAARTRTSRHSATATLGSGFAGGEAKDSFGEKKFNHKFSKKITLIAVVLMKPERLRQISKN